MKNAPKKPHKLKAIKIPNPNVKAGEVGIMIAYKKKGGEVKYYTSKGKIKHIEYFMASMVKSMCKIFKLSQNIDVVDWGEDEEKIDKKANKQRSDDRAKMDTMKAIQGVINEKASEKNTIKKLENEKTS